MTWLIPIFGALCNTFSRGGLIKTWFPRFRGGKIINAILYGLTSYLVSRNLIFASLMALGMYIGQGPALFDESTDRAILAGDKLKWSMIVFVRGLFWGLCIGIPVAIFYPYAFPWAIPAMVAMPICYSSVFWFKRAYGPIHAWSVAEFLYGLLLWLPLAFI